MNTLFFIAWSSFVVGLSGAVMPGPVLTVTIGEVMKRGFIAGPLVVLGHGLIEVSVLALLLTGLGDWLLWPEVRQAMAWVGGVLLILMGTHMIFTAPAAAAEALASTSNAPTPLRGPVRAGVITTCATPYFYIWWGTIGMSYAVLAMEHGFAGIAVFYTGHILSDLVWYTFVAFAVSSGRKVCSPTVYRSILRICGGALVLLGATFIRLGFQGA